MSIVPVSFTFEAKSAPALTLCSLACIPLLMTEALPERFPAETKFWRLDSGKLLADLPAGGFLRPDGSRLTPRAGAGVAMSLLGDAELVSEEESRKAALTTP